MKLLDRIKLTDISDEDLRATVQSFVDNGSLAEGDIVAACIARELNATAQGNGGNGKQSTANRPTKSTSRNARPASAAQRRAGAGSSKGRTGDSSRALQGKYLSALRRVPKNKRGPFSTIARDPKRGREAAIKAINAQYPQ